MLKIIFVLAVLEKKNKKKKKNKKNVSHSKELCLSYDPSLIS